MNLFLTVVIYPLKIGIECIYKLCSIITHNAGLSVIGVSAGVTLLCLPLYTVAEKWQEHERETQKKLRPTVDLIREVFKGDERYMITAAFYRENRYSPVMALRSSFGLLIQIPFFIAAYNFLSHLEALRGQSFFFIRDMGKPDALFAIGGFGVNVLPVAMTLINTVSATVYTREFALKDRIQPYALALIFLVILYNSPSGLVLYWTMNNVLSLVKNVFYTFKKPLTAFWLCSCMVCSIFAIYIVFFYHTKLAYKLVFMLCLALLYLLPLVRRGIQRMHRTFFCHLDKNRSARFRLFALSCLTLCVFSGLTIPTTLIASSPAEFSNIGSHSTPAFFIGAAFLQAAGFCLFWPLCLYFLFGSGTKTAFAVLAPLLVAMAFVNAYLFMPQYGDISASLSFLNNVRFQTVSLRSLLNLLCLALAVLLMLVLLHIKNGTMASSFVGIALIGTVVVAILNGTAIYRAAVSYRAAGADMAHTEISPVFKLSTNHPNVVLLMLDRAQAQFIPAMTEESPDLALRYDGFTFYDNTLSFNGHTLLGSPALFGGYEYTPKSMNERNTVPLVQKHNEALLLLARLFTEQNGFSATITDPPWGNYSTYADFSFLEDYPAIKGLQTIGAYTALWYTMHPEAAQLDGTPTLLERNLLFFSLFRQSPMAIRELLYRNGTWWNTDGALESFSTTINNYSVLDLLPELTAVEQTSNGTYTCISNDLTHESFFLQAPDYVPSKNVTDTGTSPYSDRADYSTQMAAFKRLARWLDFLKEQGAYDNTRIVIVADHGNKGHEDCMEPDDALDERVTGGIYSGRGHYHPLLMVKDFYAHGPLHTDRTTFMTNADTPSLLLNGLVPNPVNPFTHKDIPLDTTELKQDGVTITTSDVHQPFETGTYTFPIKPSEWWTVGSPIFKAEQWKQNND